MANPHLTKRLICKTFESKAKQKKFKDKQKKNLLALRNRIVSGKVWI